MRVKGKDVVKEKVDENKNKCSEQAIHRSQLHSDSYYSAMAQVPDLEILQGPHVIATFSYMIASRGFHHYRVTTWPDVYDGEMVSVVRETDPDSLQHDR